jgi:hypothetical protein
MDLSGANKLTDMLIGSDLDGYKNWFFKEGKIVFDTTEGYPLLKEVNLSNLERYAMEFDLSHSEKLENFRALKSGITGVKFASGVQLKNCYLPRNV